MDAEQEAKSELTQRNQRIKDYYSQILDEVEAINDTILPSYLNATPLAQDKSKILKHWNPMVLDYMNGLFVLNQGIEAANKIIRG